MLLKNHSLNKSVYAHLLIGIFCSILTIGILWLITGYYQLHATSSVLEEQTLQRQKAIQKERVQSVINLIEHEKNFKKKEIYRELRVRALQAYEMVEHIDKLALERYSIAEREALIKASLKGLSTDKDRNYFFASGTDGIVKLYPPNPDFEGRPGAELLGSGGAEIMSKIIKIARSTGEGFYHLDQLKSETEESSIRKVAYFKYYAPLDWIIGTSVHVDEIIAELQQHLIESVEQIHFDNGSYIFISNFQGISLTHPAKGKNMYEVEDSNGLKIVQELIALAKSGGGYLTYVMPPLSGERPEPKISYVEGIPDWQWYIGIGDFVADLDKEIVLMLDKQKEAMKFKIGAIFSVLGLFLIIGWLVARQQEREIDSGFKNFQNFFDRAANNAAPIDPDKLNFSEFKALAHAANLMLDSRRHFELTADQYLTQLRNIVDAMPSILAALDEHGRIIQWNKYAAEHTGINQKDADNRQISELLPYLQKHMPDIMAACHSGETFQQTAQVRTNGDSRSVNISAYPLGNDSAERLVIRIDDMTEQVRIEEMMVQTEKMLSVGGLAAGMAHEINNPLSIISQAAQNTTRRLSPDLPANRQVAADLGLDLPKLQYYLEQRGIYSFLKNIGEAVERSAGIIQNMINFTSSTASERETCSIDKTVFEALELARNDYDLKKKYRFRDVKVTTSFPKGLPPITVNRIEIEQVIFNLLKNAGQALSEVDRPDFSPEINIHATFDRKNIILRLSDNGPGIPEHLRNRILEPFFTTKEIGIGSGLGLSVAYFIVVKRHKGTFLVDSEINEGTTFTIILPWKE